MEMTGEAGPLPPKMPSVEGGYSSVAPTELPAQRNEVRVPPVELSG